MNTKLITIRIPNYLLTAIDNHARKHTGFKKINRSQTIIALLEDTMSIEISINSNWEKLEKLSTEKQIEIIGKCIDIAEFRKINYPKPVLTEVLLSDLKRHCEPEISTFFINNDI